MIRKHEVGKAKAETEIAHRHIEELTKSAQQTEGEREAWEQTAQQHVRNEDYYRGIVQDIGRMLGPEAYISDDASVQDEVLCAKVTESVAALKQHDQRLQILGAELCAELGDKSMQRLHAVSGRAIKVQDRIERLEADNVRLRAALGADNPDFDATDGASPAWWRGHDHTTKVFCALVNDILDGKDDGRGANREPWASTRKRLIGRHDALIQVGNAVKQACIEACRVKGRMAVIGRIEERVDVAAIVAASAETVNSK